MPASVQTVGSAGSGAGGGEAAACGGAVSGAGCVVVAVAASSSVILDFLTPGLKRLSTACLLRCLRCLPGGPRAVRATAPILCGSVPIA